MDASPLASMLIALLFLFISNTIPDIYACGPIIELSRSNHAMWMDGARRADALLVAITRDGKIFFGNDQVQPSALAGQIKEGLAQSAEKRIYLRVDSRAHYSSIELALNRIHDAHVEKIGILTSQ
jgi:biopolymer transport protein ExbD/biopolymer transport protein TolR